MKKLTSAQLFAAPKIAHKTKARLERAKARLERAKLVMVAARERAAERAAEMAQQSAAQPFTIRPTVLQRRRLAERLSAAVAAARQSAA
jgi:hypothetical protein